MKYTYAMTEALGDKPLLVGREPMFKLGKLSGAIDSSSLKEDLFNPAK